MKIEHRYDRILIFNENEHYKLIDAIGISHLYEIYKVRLYLMPSESKVYDNNHYIELKVKIKGDVK